MNELKITLYIWLIEISSMLKIVSFNVNGLRSALSKGFYEWLKSEQPDMLCLQETKIQPGQVDPWLFEGLGYHHYWNYAQKKGYSGIALLTKNKPVEVTAGIGKEPYDSEGRVLTAHFSEFSWVCAYFPSGTMGDIRQEIKMAFLEDFLQYLKNLKKNFPKIIVSGDFNICHKPIDINHPEKHTKMSGFLPEEREWMDRFVAEGFVDTFRVFNQQPNQYSWWSYRAGARQKNLGWRIDYHFVTENLRPFLADASILADVNFSDHCPVVLKMSIQL
ncbi:MAG: exodeoxyribonuclease III [Bacteroidales bacterium]